MIPKNFLLSVPSSQNRVTFTKVGMDVWIGVCTHTHHSLGTHDIDKLHTQVHVLRISHMHIHLYTHTQEPNTNICTYMYATVLNSYFPIQIQIIFQQQLKCGWSFQNSSQILTISLFILADLIGYPWRVNLHLPPNSRLIILCH